MKDNFAFGGSANTTVFPVALQPGPFLSGGRTFTKTKLGWTAGAGVETKLDSQWSAKIEYLYVDLGTVSEAFAIPINPAFGPRVHRRSGDGHARRRTSRDNIVRAGVNYKILNSDPIQRTRGCGASLALDFAWRARTYNPRLWAQPRVTSVET